MALHGIFLLFVDPVTMEWPVARERENAPVRQRTGPRNVNLNDIQKFSQQRDGICYSRRNLKHGRDTTADNSGTVTAPGDFSIVRKLFVKCTHIKARPVSSKSIQREPRYSPDTKRQAESCEIPMPTWNRSRCLRAVRTSHLGRGVQQKPHKVSLLPGFAKWLICSCNLTLHCFHGITVMLASLHFGSSNFHFSSEFSSRLWQSNISEAPSPCLTPAVKCKLQLSDRYLLMTAVGGTWAIQKAVPVHRYVKETVARCKRSDHISCAFRPVALASFRFQRPHVFSCTYFITSHFLLK